MEILVKRRENSMVVNMRSIAIAAVAMSGYATRNPAAAGTCTTVIQYEASGEFGANVIAGQDKYKLAGEPFSFALYACESLVPTKTGSDYAEYYPIEFEGTLKSADLNMPTPISAKTSFTLIAPSTGLDSVEIQGTVSLEGSLVPIKGDVALPAGTLSATCTNGAPANTCISPFAKVSIVTAKSQFTYSAGPWQANHEYTTAGEEILDPHGNAQQVITPGTSGATAPVWNETTGGSTTDGTVVWTREGPYTPTELSVIGTAAASIYTPPPSDKASPMLRTGAVQVVTLHADGSRSVRPPQVAGR
jgi:hypothetical protein